MTARVSDPWTDISKWPSGSDTFVEAFAKGLAVISAFGDHRKLTLTEVARRTNLPRAGARRLLYTLVTLGMARQEGDDFMLTPRILQLGFSYLSSLSLREVAQPVIETLPARPTRSWPSRCWTAQTSSISHAPKSRAYCDAD